ncbi:MAG: hydroxysqualene dehydroxylase HpnE [Acetobacteraceae bacterium]|nr:hydroxysqualene dehydroxylase HpnE [Acetobacteraceae bacterium]
MTWSHVHVVGAGLAGLAAALTLVERGVRVTLHEAGPAAGGRCRSYFDRELGCRIDNGNHLLLSGNTAAFAFLDQVGARDTLAGPANPAFPFIDFTTGERWVVRPNRGRIPFWILDRRRRVPGTRARDYLRLAALRRAGPDATVAATLRPGPLYRRLLEPLAVAALNTPPETASAQLLAAIVTESLAAGGAACIPAFPREGLSESFIDPAIRWLEARGATIRLACRVAALHAEAGRATALGPEPLAPDEAVILAVPAPVATNLMPELEGPDRFEAILNVHFRLDVPPESIPEQAGFLGMVGSLSEWLFLKPGVVSVTISAANRHAALEPVAIAQQVWHEVATALNRYEPIPPWRVLREKRATFSATPQQNRRRPSPTTTLSNVVVAGDWTATGLPATIEGAIRSGRRAADQLLTPTRE